MNKDEIKRLQENWFRINEPIGKMLGYPDCCIKAFCDQPPELLNGSATKDDILRYRAGCIAGKFTGFIPCIRHAHQILNGDIIIQSLINNRRKDLPPFPSMGEGDIYGE